MKKNALRILVFVLAVLMVLPFIASCTQNGGNGNGTTTADNNNTKDPSGSVTDDPNIPKDVDENGYKLDGLDKYNLNYNDDTVNILNWKAEHTEFFVEQGNSGDKVADAIFDRNEMVSQRLGVSLNFEEIAGNNSNIKKFVEQAESAKATGDYDIIATYSRTAATCSTKGLLKDLNSIETSYIDYTMPWYPQNLIDTMTIGDALYFISGDMSTNTIYMMYTIYANKTLMATSDAISGENLYSLVKNNEWTIDKLTWFCEQFGTGNGGKFNSTDVENGEYAFSGIYYGLDAFYVGSNLATLVPDDDNMIVLSKDFTSSKANTLAEKITAIVTNPNCFVYSSDSTPKYYYAFQQGRVLFHQDRARFAERYLITENFADEYTVLPTPLYDAAQGKKTGYITTMANPFTLYGITMNCDSASEMTAVLECWASEGYRKTTPALFESTFKGRYVANDNDREMWNIIREGVKFDLGRIYHKDVLGGYPTEIFSNAICKQDKWAITSRNEADLLQKNIEKLVKTYKDIQAKS